MVYNTIVKINEISDMCNNVEVLEFFQILSHAAKNYNSNVQSYCISNKREYEEKNPDDLNM